MQRICTSRLIQGNTIQTLYWFIHKWWAPLGRNYIISSLPNVDCFRTVVNGREVVGEAVATAEGVTEAPRTAEVAVSVMLAPRTAKTVAKALVTESATEARANARTAANVTAVRRTERREERTARIGMRLGRRTADSGSMIGLRWVDMQRMFEMSIIFYHIGIFFILVNYFYWK